MGEPMIAEVEGATAVRQPAHDDFVRPDDLLTVNAEILACAVGIARDDETPCDERAGFIRPAGLHGKPVERDIRARRHALLHLGASHERGPHAEKRFHQRPAAERVAQPVDRLRLA